MYNIIFFGPPGAGKGTQAKLFAKKFNIPHLSTGDILRSKINDEDDLANKLKEILASGKLVSDEILNEIVSDKIIKDCKNGFILDGYPRTIVQSNFLNNLLEVQKLNLDFIFNIDLDFDILEKRIIKRSQEESRDDDNIHILKTRYKEYTNSSKIVSDFYKLNNTDIFHKIDGSEEISEITSKIENIIKNSWFSRYY